MKSSFFGGVFQKYNSIVVGKWRNYIVHSNNPIYFKMKKQNIYIYALDGKVIFPYHEYRFTINTQLYQRKSLLT